MKTLKELKEFCKKNNVRYEINKRYADKDFYNFITGEWEKVQTGWSFGMNNIAGRKGLSEWSWTWFICFGEELNDETIFYFSHRYSQVNAKTYKTLTEEKRALDIIESR